MWTYIGKSFGAVCSRTLVFIISILSLGILPTRVTSQDVIRDTIRLYFLGGQSNMEGHGSVSELPDSLKVDYQDIWIFQGNPVPDESANGGLGIWDSLKPGHGAGFFSDGNSNQLSNKFGVELSFAKRLRHLYPNEKIALIKYARGGSSLDSLAAREYGSWEIDYRGVNGINQLDHYLHTISEALKITDIDNDGRVDILIPQGIIWMQGESDATITEEIALRYEGNLKRLMDLIRISLHIDDLPVVIGKISDSGMSNKGKVWQYGELVQYAQEQYVRADRNATIVRETRNYKYSDPWHYDTEGYITLGERFAEAVYGLSMK